MLAFLETLTTNSKDCSKSCSTISVPTFLRCHWLSFLSVLYMSKPALGTMFKSLAACGTTFRVKSG
jgi:hypothetical protein